MVEVRWSPGRRRVADLTRQRKTTSNVIGFTSRLEVLLVAGSTTGRDRRDAVLVALVTGKPHMSSGQREPFRVLKPGLLPASSTGSVAAPAVP